MNKQIKLTKKYHFFQLFLQTYSSHIFAGVVLIIMFLDVLFHRFIYCYPFWSNENSFEGITDGDKWLRAFTCLLIDICVLLLTIMIISLIYFILTTIIISIIFIRREQYLPLTREEMKQLEIETLQQYLEYLEKLRYVKFLGFLDICDYSDIVSENIISFIKENFSKEEIDILYTNEAFLKEIDSQWINHIFYEIMQRNKEGE